MLFSRKCALCAQALDNKRVLIVAHENITNNYYPGNNRSCLVSNCLFRVGGAACLMSNRCARTLQGSCTAQQRTRLSVLGCAAHSRPWCAAAVAPHILLSLPQEVVRFLAGHSRPVAAVLTLVWGICACQHRISDGMGGSCMRVRQVHAGAGA